MSPYGVAVFPTLVDTTRLQAKQGGPALGKGGRAGSIPRGTDHADHVWWRGGPGAPGWLRGEEEACRQDCKV